MSTVRSTDSSYKKQEKEKKILFKHLKPKANNPEDYIEVAFE